MDLSKVGLALLLGGALAFVCFVILVLTGCPLPAHVPPCTGTEAWPDPCAGAVRDAGVDAWL